MARRHPHILDITESGALMPRAPKSCGINNCRVIVTNGTRCPEHAHGWKHSPRTASSTITSSARWKALIPVILDRDGYVCQIGYPGICTRTATVVDKIVPAARRPDLAYDPRNTRAACKECNDEKARTTDRY